MTAGCATIQTHKPLDIELSKQNYNATALSRIPKEEISIYIQDKAYGAAPGLIGALIVAGEKAIDKSNARSVEEMLAPLLKATADVDFRTQYWNALEKGFSDSSWLKVNRFDKRALGYTKEEAALIKAPIIIFTTDYHLTPNAQILYFITKGNLYLKDPKTPDYFGFLTYYSEKIGKNNEEKEKAIELWAADNASAYRKALAEGIEQSMKMLRMDLLSPPANPKNETGEEINITLLSPVAGTREWKGKVLERNGSRVIIRDTSGNLLSADTSSAEK